MNQNGNSESNFGLLIGIVIAIVVGAIVGGFFPGFAKHTHILGDIFLTLLKMVVVPLVIFSMVVGITNLGDIRNLGSIGGRTVLYYMATTAISVIIGMILVNIIAPGKGIELSKEGDKYPQLSYTLSGENNLTVTLPEEQIKEDYSDKFIITLVDQNLVGEIESIEGNQVTVANWQDLSGEIDYIITKTGKTLMIAENQFTDLKIEQSGTGVAISLPIASEVEGKQERTMGQTIMEVFLGNKETGKQGMIPSNIFMAMANMDILPLIFFSLIIGAALSVIGEAGKPAIAIFNAFNEAVMQIVNWIMILAPVGIFGLIAGRIGEAGGFAEFLPELAAVGKYSMTVVLALGFHGFVVLPALLFLLGRRNPIGYAQGMGTALLNAFSTASSSATLPLTIDIIMN